MPLCPYSRRGSKPLSQTLRHPFQSNQLPGASFYFFPFSVATITAIDTPTSYMHLHTTAGSILKHSCHSIHSPALKPLIDSARVFKEAQTPSQQCSPRLSYLSLTSHQLTPGKRDCFMPPAEGSSSERTA